MLLSHHIAHILPFYNKGDCQHANIYKKIEKNGKKEKKVYETAFLDRITGFTEMIFCHEFTRMDTN